MKAKTVSTSVGMPLSPRFVNPLARRVHSRAAQRRAPADRRRINDLSRFLEVERRRFPAFQDLSFRMKCISHGGALPLRMQNYLAGLFCDVEDLGPIGARRSLLEPQSV